VLTKEHPYGLPIHTAVFRRGGSEELVVTADSKQIKGWKTASGGENLFNIETPTPTAHICLVPIDREDTGDSSGLIFASGDSERVQSFFVPVLGPAPGWTSFLDSLTEELEEKESEHVYDDYKFITRPQLDELKLSGLVGTKSLRPWMHGFFIDARLFEQVRSDFLLSFGSDNNAGFQGCIDAVSI